MNIRKVFLFIGCLLSVVGLFLPVYSLQLNGQTVAGGSALLIKSFYGIVILFADLVIVVTALAGVKKGYVIASLVSVGVTIYAVAYSALSQTGAWAIVKTTSNLLSSLDAKSKYNYEVVDGPAYVLLILAAVVILLTMLWNALNNEE